METKDPFLLLKRYDSCIKRISIFFVGEKDFLVLIISNISNHNKYVIVFRKSQ